MFRDKVGKSEKLMVTRNQTYLYKGPAWLSHQCMLYH